MFRPVTHRHYSIVENASLDDGMHERNAVSEESLNVPSTSTGHKRKSTDDHTQSTNNKQHKSGGPTAVSNKFVCKYAGCGKSFPVDAKLAQHERIHLGVKPFLCIWDNCLFRSEQRWSVVTHVRMVHFKLPKSFKEQKRLNIVDDRNPNNFIRVDADLLARRLQ